ncbi:MAG TPA: 3-dehydroquinate synthase [bacterium]|nr:3-dehydroquinate synthase [bacterium]
MNGPLRISSRLGDYEAVFEEDFGFLDALAGLANAVCVADAKVWDLYQAQLAPRFADRVLLLEAGEEKKSLAGAEEIYRFALRQTAKKNLKLVAVGGGIIQDLAGFAASTIFRGVEWHYVPSTLLAQADSCIGSKTSLNFDDSKNLLGTFYPPKSIHIHTAFLKTLSARDLHSGLGEIIKLQLMKQGPKDLEALKADLAAAGDSPAVLLRLIRSSLEVKKPYIEEDEFDRGRRNLLNYGHCFGHALESASDYGLPHGLAVTVGMVFANALAVLRGRMDLGLYARLNQDLLLPNLSPVRLEAKDFDAARLLKAMKNDKKVTQGRLAVVIPDGALNFFKLDDVTEEEFNGAFGAVLKTLL